MVRAVGVGGVGGQVKDGEKMREKETRWVNGEGGSEIEMHAFMLEI